MIIFKVKSFPEISETFVLNSIVEAIKCEKDVTIITDNLNSISSSSQPKLINAYKLLDRTLEFKQPTNKNNRIKAFILLCFNPVLLYYYVRYCFAEKKISLDYIFYLRFYKNYKNKNADTFHVHFAPALKPILTLKKIGFFKSKIIVTFHGYDAHFLPEEKKLKILLKDYEKHVNHITVNSNYLKQKLMSKGFNKTPIAIVPIGIDVNFFKPKQIKSFNVKTNIKIITVGRLIELKGQEFGIKVISELISRGVIANYTIVGHGKNLMKLKQLVKQLKIEKNVTFSGAKNQDTIKGLLEDHDVFLMPSTYDKTGTREAFGVVSLEAQAMGLPVIAFNSGGVIDTIKNLETGFIVKDRDIDAMATKIEMLFNDPNMLKSMSLNAIKHIMKNFDLKNTNKKYLELY